VWRVYNDGVPQVMDCGGFWIFWVELEMEEELVIRVRGFVMGGCVVGKSCLLVGRFEEW
jgi:hypothetical protein